MNNKTTLFLVIFLVFVAITIAVNKDKNERLTDPLAQRLLAIDEATLGMDDESKKEILIEALRGETNINIDVKQVLER